MYILITFLTSLEDKRPIKGFLLALADGPSGKIVADGVPQEAHSIP